MDKVVDKECARWEREGSGGGGRQRKKRGIGEVKRRERSCEDEFFSVGRTPRRQRRDRSA